MPPSSPLCFTGQLADHDGARIDRPSVLVAASQAVLAGPGHPYRRDPISPSPHRQSVTQAPSSPSLCWICVCVCVCAGFPPSLCWVCVFVCVCVRFSPSGSMGFMDVGRWVVTCGSVVVGCWSMRCCDVSVWLSWVWLVGYSAGVVGGSQHGLWWLGWWDTAWVVSVIGCSLLVWCFVGLLALYQRRERWRRRERER